MKRSRYVIIALFLGLILISGFILILLTKESPTNALGQKPVNIHESSKKSATESASLDGEATGSKATTNNVSVDENYSYSTLVDLSDERPYEAEWQDEFGCTLKQTREASKGRFVLIGPLGDVASGCNFGLLSARSIEEARWMQRNLFPHLSFYENSAHMDFSRLEEQANRKNVEAAIALAFKYRNIGDFESAIEWADKAIALAPGKAFPQILMADTTILLGDNLYGLAMGIEGGSFEREMLFNTATTYYTLGLTAMNNAAHLGDLAAELNINNFITDRRFDPNINIASVLLAATRASYEAILTQNGGCLSPFWSNPDMRPVEGFASPGE